MATTLVTASRPTSRRTMSLSRRVIARCSGGAGWRRRSGRGRRRPRADERDDDEHGDEHDRQPEQRPFDPPPAAVRGRLATEGGREAGAARLQQDRGRDGDRDEQLGDLKGIHLKTSVYR